MENRPERRRLLNQIKNSFSSIEQMTDRLYHEKKPSNIPKSNEGLSFREVLEMRNAQQTDTQTQLKFSKHANERLQSRSIDLSMEQVKRLEAGAAKAGAKGIVESLVMVDDYAFIVNTRNRVVVTAVTGGDDRVFTNIDGAVIG